MSGFKDFQEIVQVLDSKKPDPRVLCGFLEKVHVQGFQEPHFAQLEEVFKRLQQLSNPETLIGEEFVGALAKVYDNLVTGNLSRPEVLSLNLQLLYVIDDLCEHPEGKRLCGKHFITRLLALIFAQAGSLQLKRASIDTLGALITRSAENQKFLVVHSSGCHKLFKVFLPRCGDFQLQASTAEILFRLTRKHRRFLDLIDDEAARATMLTLYETEKPDILSGLRSFVDLVNRSLGAARSVHSFRALDAFLDDKRLHDDVWVHIGSDHLSCNFLASGEGMTVRDFLFSNIKEIKRVPPSLLELVVCKEADDIEAFSKQRLRFWFSSEDLDAAYDCCHTKLAAASSKSSAPSYVGKFSVGIHVPLPKASDFPARKGDGEGNVSQLRSKLLAVLIQGRPRDASPDGIQVDAANASNNTEPGWVQPRAEQIKNPENDQMQQRNSIPAGKTRAEKDRAQRTVETPESSSKTVADRINGSCRPSTKQEKTSPSPDAAAGVETDAMKSGKATRRSTPKTAPAKDQDSQRTCDEEFKHNSKAPDVLDRPPGKVTAARASAEKKQPSRVKPLMKQKGAVTSPKGSGRKKMEVDKANKLVPEDGETAAHKTRAGRKRQCNPLNNTVTPETKMPKVNSPGTASHKPLVSEKRSPEEDVFDFPIEIMARTKSRKKQKSLESPGQFPKVREVGKVDQPASEPVSRQKCSEDAPLSSVPEQGVKRSEDVPWSSVPSNEPAKQQKRSEDVSLLASAPSSEACKQQKRSNDAPLPSVRSTEAFKVPSSNAFKQQKRSEDVPLTSVPSTDTLLSEDGPLSSAPSNEAFKQSEDVPLQPDEAVNHQERSDEAPLPSAPAPAPSADHFDVSEDELSKKTRVFSEPRKLKRQRLGTPERRGDKMGKLFEEDADEDMRAALGGRRSRQRNRYSILDSPVNVSTRSEAEAFRTPPEEKKVQVSEALDEKVKFRPRRRDVQRESPLASAEDDVEEVSGDFIFLLANLLKKFKQKVQSRVRGKTTQILSSTSEAIKAQATTLEFQIHKDIEQYMQCCRSKLGDIEVQLHDENVKFKELCDNFDREFKQHCSRLDQMHSHVECTEDELKALSDKQRLAHRKWILQMQKASEERLKEAESKILAVKKVLERFFFLSPEAQTTMRSLQAAKQMEGLREAFYQLIDDDDDP